MRRGLTIVWALRTAAALIGVATHLGCTFDPGASAAGPLARDAGVPTDARDGIGSDTAADAALNDASAQAICEELCPGDCDEVGSCFVACGNGECEDRIVCPPGVPCHVLCEADGTCGDGVDCSAATACTVECNGDDSCAGSLDCGSAPCDLQCVGNGSCKGGIDCSDSCRCDVDCSGGGNACSPPAACPDGCGDERGCASSGDGCDPAC